MCRLWGCVWLDNGVREWGVLTMVLGCDRVSSDGVRIVVCLGVLE